MARRNAIPAVDRAAYRFWHARLLDGIPAARDQLATMLRRDLVSLVRCRSAARGCDAEAIDGAIDDAIQHYLEQPHQLNPGLGDAIDYVAQSATNRLLDWRIAETRRRRREAEAASVTDLSEFAPPSTALDDEPDLLEFARPACTPAELALLEALIRRRPRRELASILGLCDASPIEMRIELSRWRKRIVARLRRRAKRMGLYAGPVFRAIRRRSSSHK